MNRPLTLPATRFAQPLRALTAALALTGALACTPPPTSCASPRLSATPFAPIRVAAATTFTRRFLLTSFARSSFCRAITLRAVSLRRARAIPPPLCPAGSTKLSHSIERESDIIERESNMRTDGRSVDASPLERAPTAVSCARQATRPRLVLHAPPLLAKLYLSPLSPSAQTTHGRGKTTRRRAQVVELRSKARREDLFGLAKDLGALDAVQHDPLDLLLSPCAASSLEEMDDLLPALPNRRLATRPHLRPKPKHHARCGQST